MLTIIKSEDKKRKNDGTDSESELDLYNQSTRPTPSRGSKCWNWKVDSPNVKINLQLAKDMCATVGCCRPTQNQVTDFETEVTRIIRPSIQFYKTYMIYSSNRSLRRE